MMQKGKLTPLELVLRNLKHLTKDEQFLVAKHLALQCGVQMYTPADAEKLAQERARVAVANVLIGRRS